MQIDIIKSLNLNSTPSISDNLSIVNTSRILQVLSIYRNICAHNERFYITKIRVPIDDIYMNFGNKLPNTVDPTLGRKLNRAKKYKRLNARCGIIATIGIGLWMYTFLKTGKNLLEVPGELKEYWILFNLYYSPFTMIYFILSLT